MKVSDPEYLVDAGPLIAVVVLSERYPKARIITVDQRDFLIYRRFGREPLPLIMPT